MSPIRVLVVDDSVVVRRLVTDALSRDPAVEVVGFAANGRLALAKVAQLAPDLVTMDIEMPEMDGIEAVRAIRKAGHRVPIIMFSTLTERGAAATLEALSAGAQDYVTKPANVGSVQESLAQVADNLLPKIKALVGRTGTTSGPRAALSAGSPAVPEAARRGAGVTLRPEPAAHPVRVVVVGSSTGGPEALSKLVTALVAPPSVPVLVVQHMPPVFTRQLAARLDRLGPARVVEAVDGTVLEAGTVYIAPGDRHLEVERYAGALRAALTDGPPVNFCRPSVDVLFRSAVHACGSELLGVVLTGMGADGRTGCHDLVDAGGTVIVQDEATSVVWGMPGAVAMAGLAHRIVAIADVGPSIERLLAAAPVAARHRGGVA